MRGPRRIQEAMRRLALGGLLLLSTVACGEMGYHEDPPCAFDETGCTPADLVVLVQAQEDGPSAVLQAVSGLEGNSWSQAGVRGSIAWRLPDGTRLDQERTVRTATLEEKPGAVASPFEISVESGADRVSVQIGRTREGDPASGTEVFREVRLEESGYPPALVRIEPRGVLYILRVQTFWPQGEAEFFFIIRV
jgi:hypothetical protein